MPEPLSKAARKQLRGVIAVAYKRELASELAKLETHFARWRAGEIDPFELNDLLHRFHDGASRKLYNQYSSSDLEWLAASAIMRDIVTEEETGPEGAAAVQRHLHFLREQMAK